MPITQHPRDLPMPVLIAPHHHEVSDPLAFVATELAEAMRPLLNGTKILDRKNLETVRNELATKVAARILFCVGEHFLPRPGDATRVVIELDVRREIAGVLLKLLWRAAMIERVEHGGVER